MIDQIVVRLVVAALAGLAVGLEREWSGHATGPLARFAGLRTFFLLGTIGGVSGWLADSGTLALSAVLLAGATALSVAAYVVAARGGGQTVDGTTEVAAILVLALGVLAGLGYLELASGIVAVTVLALSEKERLRELVRRIGAEELRATLQFAVLALVVLPLLPDRSWGPWGGIHPRNLWIIVLVFSGLNFAGYLARRAVGPERGYGVTGLVGGLISSTAVTFQFSRLSRDDHELAAGLAVGVVGATTVLLPRLLLVSAVLNYEVALALLPMLAAPLLVGIVLVAFALARRWSQPQDRTDIQETRSPLRLASAIRMAFAFQISLMAIELVSQTLGQYGVLASAAVLGLTDMDALTLSMNRLGADPDMTRLAVRAIAIGVVANASLKLGLTLVLGSQRFRLLAGAGQLALMGATVLSIWLLW
ncbi:MAG TPA: MgtC/SapB family protein [Gemmatimonadaceae bacterium]